MTREEYIEKHIYQIAKIAGKRDDLQQIAIIGCLKAFDNGEDDPTQSIHNEIKTYYGGVDAERNKIKQDA